MKKIVYPCKDCEKASDHCFCVAFKDWFKYQWRVEVEPFRKLKQAIEKEKQDQKEQKE